MPTGVFTQKEKAELHLAPLKVITFAPLMVWRNSYGLLGLVLGLR